MPKTIEQSLDDFICRFLQQKKDHNDLLLTEFDPDWPSEAIAKVNNDGSCYWQPVRQSAQNSLANVERGLELEINKQLHTYYCRYWSDHIEGVADRGNLQLLFVWNEEDFARLQENLIAHVLMKRRLRQRETLFFAVTDEEDWILSILNETGEVVLERVGMEPKEILAPDLATFLEMVNPA